jgi:hypothetical protein
MNSLKEILPMTNRPLIAALTAILVLSVITPTWGWGRGHRLIRTWAVARLPEWQQEWIGREHLRRLATDYTSLQDAHAGGNAPEYDKYCVVPGVRVSLHDVNAAGPSAEAMQWYLRQIIACLRSGETDEAMKFLGVLCHWCEDPGCPSAHSSPVSETALRQLVPPPPDKANRNYLYGYGGIADVGRYTIPDKAHRPRLLGTSVPEAAARIYQEQRLIERQAAAHIVPIVQDMMYGDGKRADAERAEAALRNARFVTDIIYTALCLAADRVDPEETARLRTQRLSDWLSDFKGGMIPRPYYVVPYLVDQSMDADRRLHPLALPGEGDEAQVEFGFGMGTPFALEYTLAPGGVFDEFTCRAGLHPTAGPNGKVRFAVLVNGEVVHETEPVACGSPPVGLRVRLPETAVVRLALRTIPVEGSTAEHNLTVWAEPTLHRAEQVGEAEDR